MLDYLNHSFGKESHLVENKSKKNKLFINTYLLYDYSPILKLPKSLEDFKLTHSRNFGIILDEALVKMILEISFLKLTYCQLHINY